MIGQIAFHIASIAIVAQKTESDVHAILRQSLHKIECQYTAQERKSIRKKQMPLDNSRIIISNYLSDLIDDPAADPLSNELRRHGITDTTVMHDMMMKALWMHLVEGKTVDFDGLISWGIEKQKFNRGEKSSIQPMRTAKTPAEAIKMLTEKKKPKPGDKK